MLPLLALLDNVAVPFNYALCLIPTEGNVYLGMRAFVTQLTPQHRFWWMSTTVHNLLSMQAMLPILDSSCIGISHVHAF